MLSGLLKSSKHLGRSFNDDRDEVVYNNNDDRKKDQLTRIFNLKYLFE